MEDNMILGYRNYAVVLGLIAFLIASPVWAGSNKQVSFEGDYTQKELQKVIKSSQKSSRRLEAFLTESGWIIAGEKPKMVGMDAAPVKKKDNEDRPLKLISISNDGQIVVTSNRRFIATWNVTSKELMKLKILNKNDTVVAHSIQGSVVAIRRKSGDDYIFFALHLNSGKTVQLHEGSGLSDGVSFSQDGKYLSKTNFRSKDGEITYALWETATGKEIYRSKADYYWAVSGFSPYCMYAWYYIEDSQFMIGSVKDGYFRKVDHSHMINANYLANLAVLSNDEEYIIGGFIGSILTSSGEKVSDRHITHADYGRGVMNLPNQNVYFSFTYRYLSAYVIHKGHIQQVSYQEIGESTTHPFESPEQALSSNYKYFAVLSDENQLAVAALALPTKEKIAQAIAEIEDDVKLNTQLDEILEMYAVGFKGEAEKKLAQLRKSSTSSKDLAVFAREKRDLLGYKDAGQILLSRATLQLKKGRFNAEDLDFIMDDLILFGALASASKNTHVIQEAIDQLKRVEAQYGEYMKRVKREGRYAAGLLLLKALQKAGERDYEGAYGLMLTGIKGSPYVAKKFIVENFPDLFAPLYHDRRKLAYILGMAIDELPATPDAEYQPQAFMGVNDETVNAGEKKAKIQLLDE